MLVQAELAEQNQKLQLMEKESTRALVQRHSLVQQGGSAGAGLDQINGFLLLQDIRIERQKKVVGEVESRVEKLFENLRVKAVDSKIVERLKDKKRHEYEDDLRKLDQKNLDDLTTVRIAKRIQKAEKDK